MYRKKLYLSYFIVIIISLVCWNTTQYAAPLGAPPPQMSQADIDAMMKMMDDPEMIKLMQEIERDLMKMSPEELAQLEQQARAELQSLGINPDTFEPLSQETAVAPTAPQEQTVTPQQLAEQKTVETSGFMEDEIARILRKLVFFINNLRTKAQSLSALHPEYKKFDSWKEALEDLAFYTALLNKQEHHKQLTAQEFEKLMKTLKKLYTTLEKYEPQLEHTEEVIDDEMIDDPYELLGLPYTASQEDIEAVYEQYIREKDPKKLQKKLEAEGLSEKDIKRQVRAAQLTFSTITDAYEKLNDPKIRAQTDRTLKGKISHAQQAQAQRVAIIDAIIRTLSNVIYQDQLLSLCEQFMKKYEPIELAKKQELEKAEQKAQKDLEARQKLQAIKTNVGKLDQTYSPVSNYPSSYSAPSSYGSYGGYPYDTYGGYNYPSSYDSSSYGTPSSGSSPGKAGGSGAGGSTSGGSKPDNDGNKKEDKKEGAQKKEKKEAAQHPFEKALASFEKELTKLEQAYEKQDVQAAFTTLQKQNAPTTDQEAALATLQTELSPFLKTVTKDADKVRTEMNNLPNFKQTKFVPSWEKAYTKYQTVTQPLHMLLNAVQAPPATKAPQAGGAAAAPAVQAHTQQFINAAAPLQKQLSDLADGMKTIYESVNPPAQATP